MEKAIDALKLSVSVIVCLAAGFIGSFFTTPSIATWYARLNKPFFNPPNWIFAPVWTTLFILMGVALFLVWSKGVENKNVRAAIRVFGAQLFFNVLWSLAFFGLHAPFIAFGVIVILWGLIALTIMDFYRISRIAGILLVPYILWVSFASILNLAVALLNI